MALKNCFLTLLFVYFVVSTFHGCSGNTIDNDSPPEAQYAEGERLMKKDRYIEAVERFRILKSRYPYSKYAALATLKIGDVHFQEESFIEAASAYKIFRELYPKHENAAYALYRIGECYYNLMPSTADRDLDPATSAIEAYSQYRKEYPGAPEQKKAEERVHELREKLAEKENYVGEFYFKRDLYQAAASRYLYLLENYSEFSFNEIALYRLAYSYERIGEYKKASDALNRLVSEFPQKAEDSSVKKLRASVDKSLSTAE